MHIDFNALSLWPSLAAGALIGLAAAMLVLLNGQIAGISGIVGGLLRPRAGALGWRVAFIVGLLAAPWLALHLGLRLPSPIAASPTNIVLAGFLVGLGTRYGGGCTSGHGVCGLARRSPRSMVATACFMASGFATVYVLRHLLPL